MPLTPHQMMEARRILNTKTGRSVEEWAMLARQQGLSNKKKATHWLQTVHGLGQGQAKWIATRAFRAEVDSPPSCIDLVEGRYAGSKQGLLPIYESLVCEVQSLGDEASIAPRATYLSLVRRRQFGIFQAKKESVLLGLALPGQPFEGQWVETRHLGSNRITHRITHRIALTSPEEVHEKISRWLFLAYDRDHE